jgi:hypothetical protein
MGPVQSQVTEVIKLILERFKIQEEGDMCEFLGIEVTKGDDGSLSLRQPHLIDSILKDLHLDKGNVTPRMTPALKTRILHKDTTGEPFDESFHYRSIIGKLNYLEKSTRPDLSFAVHQCARFCSDPKKSHATAVKYIGRYLATTKDKGIQVKPNNPTTARSRTGYVIQFAGYPIVWASKIQTKIALSVTEAEYIALSTAAREILPLISLATEAAKAKVIEKVEAPKIRCKYLKITWERSRWPTYLKGVPAPSI